MKIFTNSVFETKYKDIINLAPSNDKASLYIDIETTGFSRKNDMIYLVGLVYYKDNDLIIEQYLTEKLADEYELLFKLNQFVTQFDELIHFNGDSFDLPFIIERMKLYRIRENISKLNSLDFLKQLRPYKKVLGTDNLKLKTMEQLAGYRRVDPFSGGELIQMFQDYLNGNKALETTFVLHNEEDMVGLYYLNVFRPLISLTSNSYDSQAVINKDANRLELSFPIESSNHFTTYIQRNEYSIELSEEELLIYIPIITGEFKTFFDDYKQYYYLTLEDYAIHESLASFVQSKFKKKATKHTAFTKANDTFYICPFSKSKIKKLDILDDTVYIFSETINDSFSLIRITDIDKTLNIMLPAIIKELIS